MTVATPNTMHDGRRLIFVGGSPRSGTTLVQNILDSHPGIFGGPEFLHLWRIIDLRDRLHQSVARGYIDQICSHDEVDTHIRTLIEGFISPLAKGQGNRLISEKTPANVLAFSGLAELWPQARFIHVVRDPRGIVSSLLEVGAKAARQGCRKQEFTRDANAAISYIQQCFDAGFEAAQREPERVFTLVYEALVRNPKLETQKLCAFLGIDWSTAMIRPAAHKHTGEQAITVRSDEVWYDVETYNSNPHTDSLNKWRDKLAPSQQIMICNAFQTNPHLARLGYDLSTRSLQTRTRLIGTTTRAMSDGIQRMRRMVKHAYGHRKWLMKHTA